jgi:branched-chain amino acid transport system ATP-binding protein
MLRLEHVSVAYGKHEALRDITLDLDAGRTTVILGANGAGKTTLLKTVAGLVRPKPGGRILFDGRPIEHEPPHRIVASGIALVPEGRRLFGEMTVLENLRLGAYTEHARAGEHAQIERQLMLFPRLRERRDQIAKTMSGGEQQMLAIARALMSEPKILLLDEPSLGLGPRLVVDLFSALRAITKTGQSVILVEQNVHQSLKLADYVYVLENGRIHSSGTPQEILDDTVIQQAYLGLEQRPAAAVETRAAADHYGGGFVNPFARTVMDEQAAAAAAKERPMTSRVESIPFGAGFYNPYARSIGEPTPHAPAHTPHPAQPAHRASDHAHAKAPRAEDLPRSGGVYNPYARSIDEKK